MRTRNSLERLAAAGRPLLADGDSLVGPSEQNRILERILISARDAPVYRRRHRTALVLVCATAVAAAIAFGAFAIGRGGAGHHPQGLTGAAIQLAGYRFRTPAGFTRSSSSCSNFGPGNGFGINPRANAWSSAGSADGGCVAASMLGMRSGSPIPSDAVALDVGGYQGYLVRGSPLVLYVYAPPLDSNTPYLVLTAKGVTQEQLVAIALSGLPAAL